MTARQLSEILSALLMRGRRLLGRRGTTMPTPRRDVPLPELCDALLSRRGEVSGTAIACQVLDRYSKLDSSRRRSFFEALAEKFGPDHLKLESAVTTWRRTPETDADLHFASEPRRQELFRRLNSVPHGTAALVRMREQVLAAAAENRLLKVVDRDLMHLLSSWFNSGFLVLQPIDWMTPVKILERIIEYEAVHAIQNWDDLRNRLKPLDRRCFAFFHPQLPDEPLIFVEVALTGAVPSQIGPLLNPSRAAIPPEEATTAVFYSISNTQKGLVGISFGNFLIKQVVFELQQNLPHIQTFITLSPVPGFARWLARERANACSAWIPNQSRPILALLDRPDWHGDPGRRAMIRDALLPVAAKYLVRARNSAGRPVDPVARFHLGNGARLERLNFLGDISPRGLEQSHGLMVNYRYALEEIDRNHEAYAEKDTVVTSAEVDDYLRTTPGILAAIAPAAL